jgi:hypothetical protein
MQYHACEIYSRTEWFCNKNTNYVVVGVQPAFFYLFIILFGLYKISYTI